MCQLPLISVSKNLTNTSLRKRFLKFALGRVGKWFHYIRFRMVFQLQVAWSEFDFQLCIFKFNTVRSCVSSGTVFASKLKKTKMMPNKRLKISCINEILPDEIMILILKKLNYKSLSYVRSTCRRWKDIIHGFDLLKLTNFSKHFQNCP